MASARAGQETEEQLDVEILRLERKNYRLRQMLRLLLLERENLMLAERIFLLSVDSLEHVQAAQAEPVEEDLADELSDEAPTEAAEYYYSDDDVAPVASPVALAGEEHEDNNEEKYGYLATYAPPSPSSYLATDLDTPPASPASLSPVSFFSTRRPSPVSRDLREENRVERGARYAS